MFENLRKKLSEAVKGLVKREEKVVEQEQKSEETRTEPIPIQKEEKKHEPAPKAEEGEPPKHHEEKKPEPVHKKEEKKRGPIVKLSITTKLKSIIIPTVTLKGTEIEPFLENIKISMLESDVSFETTEDFIESLRNSLSTAKIDAKHIGPELIKIVRGSLFEILAKSEKGIDIFDFVREKKASGPVRILFLGPNGTGKTTTMAKIAHHFKKTGTTSVLSASDTFRAAAIEQTEHHANKLGVPVIKSKYGADPASIAFDAIAYAKAHKIDVVLIDSAGRQETNKNLIREMEKMVKVAQPDLIIFVGESTAGNRLSEQIKEFNKFMKINGIILTKLDADAKGGNAISISHTTGIPILFFGTGEAYDALVPYTPEFIVDAIAPNN